jgi:hypothetical protein
MGIAHFPHGRRNSTIGVSQPVDGRSWVIKTGGSGLLASTSSATAFLWALRKVVRQPWVSTDAKSPENMDFSYGEKINAFSLCVLRFVSIRFDVDVDVNVNVDIDIDIDLSGARKENITSFSVRDIPDKGRVVVRPILHDCIRGLHSDGLAEQVHRRRCPSKNLTQVGQRPCLVLYQRQIYVASGPRSR